MLFGQKKIGEEHYWKLVQEMKSKMDFCKEQR